MDKWIQQHNLSIVLCLVHTTDTRLSWLVGGANRINDKTRLFSVVLAPHHISRLNKTVSKYQKISVANIFVLSPILTQTRQNSLVLSESAVWTRHWTSKIQWTRWIHPPCLLCLSSRDMNTTDTTNGWVCLLCLFSCPYNMVWDIA